MTSTTTAAPAFFISHGAPTFAIEPGILGPQLAAMGKQLSGARAVLVVSPHWQTRGVSVMTTEKPPTVHDFGGFPVELYALQYPVQGQPALAGEAARVLADAGWSANLEARRGLDHGAWVPLMHMLPAADVPVFQVSMPHDLDAAGAFRLGQSLAPLRQQGVVILASGSMTHNLHEIFNGDGRPDAYALEFAHWVRNAVTGNNTQSLVDYRRLAPHAQRAHPTDEHFLPLLVAMGAQAPGETAQYVNGGVTFGVLSMDSYTWGLPS